MVPSNHSVTQVRVVGIYPHVTTDRWGDTKGPVERERLLMKLEEVRRVSGKDRGESGSRLLEPMVNEVTLLSSESVLEQEEDPWFGIFPCK